MQEIKNIATNVAAMPSSITIKIVTSISGLPAWSTWLLVLPAAALAQGFEGLATNYDGSVLYFTSSARQTGGNQSFHSKIYRWDASGGVRVAAEQPDTGADDFCTTSNFYNLVAPQISLDGTTFAYTGTRPNTGPARFCPPAEPNQGVVVQAGKAPVTIAGRVSISPNGRYAIGTPLGADQSGYHSETDLNRGFSSLVAGAIRALPQQVTDAGTALTANAQAVILSDPNGATRVVPTQPFLDAAVVDRAGKTIYYSTGFQPNSSSRLFALDIASGAETLLDSSLNIQSISVTADGGTVLYISAPHLLSIATLATGTARTVNAARYSSATISGDGRVGYGLAAGGGIDRIDILSGETTLVTTAPPVPAAFLVSGDPMTEFAAGSVVTLLDASVPPLSVESVCGRAPQIIASSSRTDFQIPFDQPEGPCEVVTASGPYESALEFYIDAAYPRFVYNGLFAHADFHLITNSSPAVPGEAMVAWMTGLGPVDDRGFLELPIACTFNNVPADVLYAGVASAYPGIYQINLRVPNVVPASATLRCSVPGSVAAVAQVPIAAGPT